MRGHSLTKTHSKYDPEAVRALLDKQASSGEHRIAAEKEEASSLQLKTYTRWWNAMLSPRGHPVTDLLKDLSTGILPIKLIEVLEHLPDNTLKKTTNAAHEPIIKTKFPFQRCELARRGAAAGRDGPGRRQDGFELDPHVPRPAALDARGREERRRLASEAAARAQGDGEGAGR